MKYLGILVSTIVLLTSACNRQEKTVHPGEMLSFRTEVKDSIIIDEPLVDFSDENENHILFFSRATGDIIVWDKQTKKSTVFNHYGGGEKEYPAISNLIYLWNDSIIDLTNYEILLNLC